MIAEKNDITIRQNGNFEKVTMGIKVENMGHILDLLSSLYSNPISSVQREYLSNAYDEHVKWAVKRPVTVTLPSTFEPYFKIRDYAKGLSHEQVIEIYSQYGESTKRDENDAMANFYNGQMGIGAKSGLCYGTKSFAVSSYRDGVMSVYNCYTEADGLPTFAKLFSADTEEPDGLEVSIPVIPSDISRFHQEAKHVFTYFSPKPEVIGGVEGETYERPNAVNGLEGKDWRLVGNGLSYVVMGNVAYPIDRSYFVSSQGVMTSLLDCGIEIEVPIGEVSIAPSREALKYTPKTKQYLTDFLTRIISELGSKVQSNFATAANLWDAKYLYHKVFYEMGNIGYTLKSIFKNSITWNGIVINNDSFSINTKGVKIVAFERSYINPDILSATKSNAIRTDNKNIVVMNDLGTGKGSPTRINKLWKETSFNTCYVILFETPLAQEEFYKTYHFDTVPVTYLSSIEMPVSEKGAKEATTNPKHTLKCFEWGQSSGGPSSTSWNAAEIDFENGNGVYVNIDKFQVILGHNNLSPYYFQKLLDRLKVAGVTLPPIYGIKSSVFEKKKLGSGWISLTEFAKTELNKLFGEVSQEAVDYAEVRENGRSSYNAYQSEVGRIENKTSLFRQYVEAQIVNETNIDKIDAIMAASRELGINKSTTIKPTHDLTDLCEKLLVKYPLLNLLSNYTMSYYIDAVIHYVNCVDKAG